MILYFMVLRLKMTLRFFSYADIIVANRVYPELKEFSKKVFTRDLYESD